MREVFAFGDGEKVLQLDVDVEVERIEVWWRDVIWYGDEDGLVVGGVCDCGCVLNPCSWHYAFAFLCFAFLLLHSPIKFGLFAFARTIAAINASALLQL